MNKDIKVLLADDSAFMRKVLKDILGDAGFSQFIECGNGKECLEKYESEKPELLLLDIIMPEMSGMEVLKKIGFMSNVIIISAMGQSEMMNDAKKYGAKGYIVKPFDRKKVIDEIENVLGK
ncbi:MAG: response regulator [Patescibacteria group bacterium]